MSEQSVPIQQIDPPLMLTSEGNKSPQMTNPNQGMSNLPTSPPPPYPQQSFAAMPPTQAQPQQQYAQPQYQQQQPQPQQLQYQQQQPQQPQYQQQQYQQTPQPQYQQPQQYQQPVQMQTQTQTYSSQPSQVVSESVHVRDVSTPSNVVYVENQPPPQQTIIMQNTQVMSITSPLPTTVTCPRCSNTVTTVVSEVPGTTTYMLSAILCIVGCLPLAWLPWVMSGCLDKVHTCPACGNVLATVKA